MKILTLLRLLALLAALCAGCVRAEDFSPASLRTPGSVTVLHLDKSLRYEDPDAKGLFASQAPERGLLPGDYVSEFEDAGGTFYRGSGTCVLVMTLPHAKTQIFGDGGVYVPKVPGKPFRLYRYRMLGTEHVLSSEPDINGDWSVTPEDWSRSLFIIASLAPAQREPNPPESLCGATRSQRTDAEARPGGVVVVATVPRAPLASGLGSGISSLLINALIESGRGQIHLMAPPPAGVSLRGATFLRSKQSPSIVAADAASAASAVAGQAGGSVRHLDATMLEGHTWTFPHLRDPSRFGQVELRFVGDRVQASNSQSQSEGRYAVNDDRVCVDFESSGWGRICYYVRDMPSTSEGKPAAMVVNAATGAAAPLAIH